MEIIQSQGYEFIKYEKDKAKAVFFTACEGADFYLKGENFKEVIGDVKRIFNLSDIGFQQQIHSDIVRIYENTMGICEGDGLITNKKNTALGVFTADCVPVLIYDSVNEAAAAVHSGWKGTYSRIVSGAVRKLNSEYGSRPEDLYVYIGPHIGECCYEVGRELINLFQADPLYKNYQIIKDNKLNLSMCIKAQCLEMGITVGHIFETSLCTFCSEQNHGTKLHSYRKNKESSGRMLSLIYIEE